MNKGSLQRRRDSWLGKWTIKTPDGRTVHRCVKLGDARHLTESGARQALELAIYDDHARAKLLNGLPIGKRIVPPNAHPSSADMKSRPAAAGAMAEMIVCADLIERGFDVYRAVNPDSKCDLVACSSNGPIRIEVKRTRIRPSAKLDCEITNHGYFDVLAIVGAEGDIRYINANSMTSSNRPIVHSVGAGLEADWHVSGTQDFSGQNIMQTIENTETEQ